MCINISITNVTGINWNVVRRTQFYPDLERYKIELLACKIHQRLWLVLNSFATVHFDELLDMFCIDNYSSSKPGIGNFSAKDSTSARKASIFALILSSWSILALNSFRVGPHPVWASNVIVTPVGKIMREYISLYEWTIYRMYFEDIPLPHAVNWRLYLYGWIPQLSRNQALWGFWMSGQVRLISFLPDARRSYHQDRCFCLQQYWIALISFPLEHRLFPLDGNQPIRGGYPCHLKQKNKVSWTVPICQKLLYKELPSEVVDIFCTWNDSVSSSLQCFTHSLSVSNNLLLICFELWPLGLHEGNTNTYKYKHDQ